MKPKYLIALAALSLIMIAVPVLIRRRPAGFFKRFILEAETPYPLALFRIVFFLACLFPPYLIEADVVRYSRLSADLLFPPLGWEWLLSVVPIRELDTRILYGAYQVLLVLSAIGLWTRASIIGSLITGVWLLGIPQFFGKIDHYHHLIWFMAVFAVSPCGDVLSIDGLRKAWARADRGSVAPPAAAPKYGVPLKMFWLLMGVTYFWTGFWKAWTGPEWAFSDNLRFIMYNQWAFLNWVPALRIDRYPIVYQTAAAMTILFEMTFILAIFHRFTRQAYALAGLGFHNGTSYFLRIGFWHMQICYVSLIDWTRLWNWMGRRLFPTEMRLVFDGNCELCRRTIAMLRTFDVLNRVEYINGLDRGALAAAGLDHIHEEALLTDMHAVEGGRISTGYDAYRRWCLRLPPLWVLVPVLYLPVVRAIGMRIYRRVADARTCSLVHMTPAAHIVDVAREHRWVRNSIVVGYALVMMVALCSLAKFHSWPFAGYPTFEGISGPELKFLTVHISTPSLQRDVSVQELYQKMHISGARLLTLTGRIIALPASVEKDRKFCALWTEIAAASSLPREATLTFYEDLLSTYPEDRGKPPLKRQQVYETTACRPGEVVAAR